MRRVIAKLLGQAAQAGGGVKTSLAGTGPREMSSSMASAERIMSSFTASTSNRCFSTRIVVSSRRSMVSHSFSTPYSSFAARIPAWPEAALQHHLKRASQKFKPSYEWVLGTGYNARVAIINALYMMQPSTHWARLLSILLAEAVTRGDPLAWCYQTPVTAKEQEYLRAAEEADEAAAKGAQLGVFRRLLSYFGSVARLTWLLFLFSPVVFLAPIAVGPGQSPLRRKKWLRLLRQTLERAGPAFIKWGQWAATRADLFPPDLCSELELLHTQAPMHGFSHTACAVEAAFGFPLKDLFSEFDPEPVASGSIGQIHRAVLSGAGARLTGVEEGTVVAVKVRHPGVGQVIERDFALMMAAARLAGSLPALRTLRLEESLKQFAAPLREQVDLAREGFYLHAFNYNFRGEARVSFPVPLYPLVGPEVLVETFEKGDHISTYVARGANAPYNSDLARVGARTMLHMLVVDNLVHSDLHPGNILVRLDAPWGQMGEAMLGMLRAMAQRGAEWFGWEDLVRRAEAFDASVRRPSIVLLDAGMATRLSPEDQINMVGLFDAFSRLDALSVANWVLRFAGEEQSCPDPEGFRRDLEVHFAKLKDENAFSRGDTSSGAEALAAVLETVRQHQVVLPGHICATVVTTLVLEGWSHSLDPAHSTLSEVKRIIALKKGETKLRKVAMWVQGAAVDREILEHVPRFAVPARTSSSPSPSLLSLKASK